MSFNWKQMKELAVKKSIARAKIQAKGQHPDFKRIHPDEARDGAKGQFTLLTQRVTKEIKDKQDLAILRRAKNAKK